MDRQFWVDGLLHYIHCDLDRHTPWQHSVPHIRQETSRSGSEEISVFCREPDRPARMNVDVSILSLCRKRVILLMRLEDQYKNRTFSYNRPGHRVGI